MDMLHPSDRPAWLTDLQRDLKLATQNHNDQLGVTAVHRIASDHYPRMLAYSWKSSGSDNATGFDFDPVFEKYRNECRIPELFDELIGFLQQIIESGEVDSVRMLSELEKIISTLRNARNGSYFATRGAWFFVATWFTNTGWELLGSIPIAGSVFKGLQKTLEETNSQMVKMHDDIQHELEQQIAVDFPRLEYHPPTIPKLEGPKESGDSNAIDNGSDDNEIAT